MPSKRPSHEQALRRQIVEAGRRLWTRGLVVACDGNLSVRLGPKRILITPAGVNKGFLAPGESLVVDLEGRTLRRGRKSQVPSTEMAMHLEVYRTVASAGAVIHAHPPCATALTVAGIPFPSDILPEIAATLGDVPTTRLVMPGTDEDAQVVHPWLPTHRAILLPHHGSLTYGVDLEEALEHLERIEHAAWVYWLASTSGNVNRLPRDLLARLEALRPSSHPDRRS